jgi:hypothetical protein
VSPPHPINEDVEGIGYESEPPNKYDIDIAKEKFARASKPPTVTAEDLDDL